MKILVTGAGGFLGFHVAKILVSKGYDVVSFSRTHHESLNSLNIKTICGDLSKVDDVMSACIGQDAIFHIASKVGMWGRWQEFYNINVVGTQNVIDACKKFKIKKLIYTSTPSVVFGREDLCGVDEQTPIPTNHLNDYAKSKAIAEQLVLQVNDSTNFLTLAIRPHLIFGQGDPHLVPTLIDSARKNKIKIIGNGKNLVDVIHVENAAIAHVQAFEALEQKSVLCGQAYFIGQDEPVLLYDFINNILKIYNITPIKKSMSLNLAYFIGAIFEFFYNLFSIYGVQPPMTRFIALQLGKSHYFSHDKAKKDFGYQAGISTSEAIEKLK